MKFPQILHWNIWTEDLLISSQMAEFTAFPIGCKWTTSYPWQQHQQVTELSRYWHSNNAVIKLRASSLLYELSLHCLLIQDKVCVPKGGTNMLSKSRSLQTPWVVTNKAVGQVKSEELLCCVCLIKCEDLWNLLLRITSPGDIIVKHSKVADSVHLWSKKK